MDFVHLSMFNNQSNDYDLAVAEKIEGNLSCWDGNCEGGLFVRDHRGATCQKYDFFYDFIRPI